MPAGTQPYWSKADNAFIVPDSTWSATQHKTFLGLGNGMARMFSGSYLSFSDEVPDG